MPLSKRTVKKIKSFDTSVSYKIDETRDRLRDARNVFTNQGRLETRFGYSRYNSTSLSGSILSSSYFKMGDGTTHLIAKVGTVLYSVASSGAHTTLKTGLSATTKHRGVTFNRGTKSRHFISIEGDGLFSYDGTNVDVLGESVPTAPSVATGTGSLTNGTYTVSLTFYASTIGYETNEGAASSQVTTSSQGIDVSSIPSSATHSLIDKVRVYLTDVGSGGDPVFVTELNIGTTTYTIDEDPTSSLAPPTKNAQPLSGGGKYLTEFNGKLVYAGNSTYPSDVFFSETDLPDAFDDNGLTQNVQYIAGNGPVTGIVTGFFNDSVLDPYLVIFKKRSIHIYSEIGGQTKIVPISTEVGCVSHDTIIVKNGDVAFMSEQGWNAIVNGRLLVNEQKEPQALSQDIQDIFRSSGYVYELNRAQFANCFSVYYSTLDQYLTFVAEGANNSFYKVYNYEFDVGGFKPYDFQVPCTSAVIGENSSGDEVVYFSDNQGYFYTHSIYENRTDVDIDNTSTNIAAFALMNWVDGDDYDASFHFREFLIRAVAGSNTLTVKAFINFDMSDFIDYSYTFTDPNSGFILDLSKLDEGIFNDERTIITSRADINRVGENLLIGFYQEETNANMNIISTQLNFNKHGNRN